MLITIIYQIINNTNQEQDGIGTSFDPNQNTNANWHNVKLYDRILTADEILQNFNAQRGRYGL
jgi:hypothetical protein